VTVHRSPYKVGDTFTAEEARSLGGSRATFPPTLDTFTVQEVIKMGNKSGSYYIYATSPSTEISFSVMSQDQRQQALLHIVQMVQSRNDQTRYCR